MSVLFVFSYMYVCMAVVKLHLSVRNYTYHVEGFIREGRG